MWIQRTARSLSRLSRRSYVSDFRIPSSLPRPLTKVVATIGPTSEQEEPLKRCVTAGLDVMRLNFSHATPEEVELRCGNLKKTSNPYVSILLDTKGPELRSGKLLNDVSGHDTIDLVAGDSITLHATPDTLPEGGSTTTDLLIDFPVLPEVLQVGRSVLLDDGAVILRVSSIADVLVQTEIMNSGSLRSRAGVNLPYSETAQYLPALSDKDKADIEYGMRNADIDFVAASFVQNAQHVNDIRDHCETLAQELGWTTRPQIISKIETGTALDHFDEILEVSDGIMVARGDLGVEVPLTQVTVMQKEMIRACNHVGKPVIVATQMMESMGKAPRPTRAEVSDVTNAVYDGTDCVMLSGETAKGKYPDTTIETMKEICQVAEFACATRILPESPAAQAARDAIDKLEDADCIVADAPMAPFLSRAPVPVYVVADTLKEARQLNIWRGVFPVLDESEIPSGQTALVVDGSSTSFKQL